MDVPRVVFREPQEGVDHGTLAVPGVQPIHPVDAVEARLEEAAWARKHRLVPPNLGSQVKVAVNRALGAFVEAGEDVREESRWFHLKTDFYFPAVLTAGSARVSCGVRWEFRAVYLGKGYLGLVGKLELFALDAFGGDGGEVGWSGIDGYF